MGAIADDGGDLDDLPPSAKFVAHVLQRDGPLTTEELRDETGLCESTLRGATTTLVDRGVIERDVYPRDLRKRVYRYVPAGVRRSG